MRTFVSALLVSAALAQNTTTNSTNTTSTTTTIKDSVTGAVDKITSWLKGFTSDNLSTDHQQKDFTFYAPTNTTLGLSGWISLDNTALGANFVTVGLHLTGPVDRFANGTTSLVYFQVEKPVEGVAHRLLQNTTNATGTGSWEGWGAALTQPAAATKVVTARNFNTWGTANLKSDNRHWNAFGGNNATATGAASAWQMSDEKLQTSFQGNATANGVWHSQVYRLASAVDSLKFKFVPDQTYHWQAGHRWWPKGANSTTVAAQALNSDYLSFMFDGATHTLYGAGAIALVALTAF